jgi:hypothetical protein
MKYIQLTHDPREETAEAFQKRKAEAIAATGEPENKVGVIVNEIIYPKTKGED